MQSKTLSFIKHWILGLLVGSALVSEAQVVAYFNASCFNSPGEGPYLETQITIVGQSLASKADKGLLKNSAHLDVKIFRDTSLVKTARYNVIGPGFPVGEKAPVFIDEHRYALPNGNYRMEVNISDNFRTDNKSLLIVHNTSLAFSDTAILLSDIQALEKYSKAEKTGPLTKSGYDLVPYTVNYYPESSNRLSFYVEAYNTAKKLGTGKTLVYQYYLEGSNDQRINSFGAFRKMTTQDVNPLLASIDISGLGTGDYNLVVELRDENNIQLAGKKYFFQRLNRQLDVVSLQKFSEANAVAAYVGHTNNRDTLKMYVECLWPIADNIDKERITNQAVKQDPELMKKFIVDFWQRRAADTADPVKLWASYYREVQVVMHMFKCGKQKGYYTDRGRVYLQYGAPSQRTQQLNEQNTFPYEIWQYYRTTDATNGQFFSNRKFVFVNKMLGDDCFELVHSDMRGEIYNSRWQFELTRRNNQGLADPDNDVPAGTQHNQFDDFYSNPR